MSSPRSPPVRTPRSRLSDVPSDTVAAEPSRRRAILLMLLALGIAVVVFGVVFPRLIDWDVVLEVLRDVSGWEIALLVILGLVKFLPSGWLYSLVLPGLTLARGVASWIATTALASSTPGFDIPLRFAMYASWGYSPERTTSAAFLSGIVEMSTKYTLAVVGVGAWAVIALDGTLALLAGVGAAILVGLGGVTAAALRSERYARRLAGVIDRVVRKLLGWFNRTAPDDLVQRIVSIRVEARGALGRNWLRAFLAAAAAQAISFAILLLSLRAVGVGADTLAWYDVLLAEGVVIILTTIPITPGNVGIAETAYMLVFTPIAGRDAADIVAAGVVLARLVVWLIPIPIGWIITLRWQTSTGSSLFGRSTHPPDGPPRTV